MLGTTLVDADRSKLGVHKGSGTFLSCGYFEVSIDVNLEGAQHGEDEPLGI